MAFHTQWHKHETYLEADSQISVCLLILGVSCCTYSNHKSAVAKGWHALQPWCCGTVGKFKDFCPVAFDYVALPWSSQLKLHLYVRQLQQQPALSPSSPKCCFLHKTKTQILVALFLFFFPVNKGTVDFSINQSLPYRNREITGFFYSEEGEARRQYCKGQPLTGCFPLPPHHTASLRNS